MDRHSQQGSQRYGKIVWLLVGLGVLVLLSLADEPTTRVSNHVANHFFYTCPDPSLPRPAAFVSEGSRSEPVELPATANWTVTMTYDLRVCNAFDLVISRRDKGYCAQVEEEIEPARDPATHEHISKRLGPDTFVVQVEGAERMMSNVPTEYLGDCEYLFRFQPNNGGRLWVTASLVHEEYNGFLDREHEEFSDPHPPLVSELVLDGPTELDLCGSRCMNHLVAGPVSFPAFPPTSQAAQAQRDRASLPSCRNASMTGTIDGGYFQSNAYDLLYPMYRSPYSSYGRTTAGYTGYVPFGCEWRHDGTRFADHRSCLEPKRSIFFAGDSHSRTLYDLLRHRFEGNREVLPITKQEDKTLESKLESNLGNLHLEFHWDPFMLVHNLDCKKLEEHDSFIINTGSHALARHCLSVPQWRAELDRILGVWSHALKTCNGGRHHPKLIFLTTPVFFERSYYHDCRTGPRTAYWNQIAAEKFSSHGWQVIDIEKYTKPVAADLLHMDNIHYTKLDALEPMGDDLIERLELCGTGGSQ